MTTQENDYSKEEKILQKIFGCSPLSFDNGAIEWRNKIIIKMKKDHDRMRVIVQLIQI